MPTADGDQEKQCAHEAMYQVRLPHLDFSVPAIWTFHNGNLANPWEMGLDHEVPNSKAPTPNSPYPE